MLPQRTRLISGEYILDIIEAQYSEKLYYYTVHRRESGEIVTLGHESTFEEARTAAANAMQKLVGKPVEFGEASNGASSVA